MSGQIADILVGKRHDRPGEHDLTVQRTLFQGCGQGQQGLAGAGLAGNGHQRHLGIAQGMHGKALLGVARYDSVD